MNPADEYLATLADTISDRVDAADGACSLVGADAWNPSALIQGTPEVDVQVDPTEFDAACLAAKARSVAELAWTPGVPEKLRDRLATHIHHEVRGRVAACTRNEQLYQELSGDKDHRVRAAAVQSRFTTADRFREFAKDRRAEVRESVAADARTPRDVVLALTQDRSATVRGRLVWGPHMYNREVLTLLSHDPDGVIMQQVEGTLWSLDHPAELRAGGREPLGGVSDTDLLGRSGGAFTRRLGGEDQRGSFGH